jgi:nucleotide-binding universal stress UspA family protein
VEAGKRIDLKSVLFATDFSPTSNAALPYALAIAHQFGATLYGANVLGTNDYLLVAPEAWSLHIQNEEQLQLEALARLEKQLHGVPHKALTGAGDVEEVLFQFIAENDIDLLVLGSHGRTGARKLLMGSIAEKIFRRSSCPVLTVGPNVVQERKSVAEFNEILLATDFGEGAIEAAAYAVSLAHEHQARLSLLHIVDPSEPTTTDVEPNPDVFFSQLQELVPRDTPLSCHPEYFIQFGPRAQRIVQFAGCHGTDLIVMGVHPAAAVSAITHLAHTVAQHIVAHAVCPVLTVRGS